MYDMHEEISAKMPSNTPAITESFGSKLIVKVAPRANKIIETIDNITIIR